MVIQMPGERKSTGQRLAEAQKLIEGFERIEGRLAEHVTWDLVHELQQAADLAGGMGQVNVEKRLSRWSVKLVNALCASSAPRSEESTSQYWIG